MSPLTAYHSLLLSNLSTVQTIESALSNVTWLLPGRFQDAEVASEGLYALLSLVSSYHDTILSHHLSPSLSLPPHPFASSRQQPITRDDSSVSPLLPETTSTLSRTQPLLPPPSDHTRYTRYWTSRSALYRRASRALTTLGYLELLIEMVMRRKAGERARWRVVLGVEGMKTFLRLIILRITSRPVLSPPTPQREVDLASLPTEVIDLSSSSSSAESELTTVADRPLTPSLAAYAPLRCHLFPMVGSLPESHLPHPRDLLPKLRGSEYFAEILSSSVGLIHVLLLIRASRQASHTPYRPTSLPTLSRSLPPYLIALLLSLLARHLRSTSSARASPLLLSHYAAQDRKLATRAFLTGPMWIGWTRPKVMSVVKTLERVPLLGLVGELVEGYLPLVDDYFFCKCIMFGFE
ncbi:hypothetical protein IAR55_003614 [Kwoniella newhampshirensis]|uniref:Peroxisomal membrane protein PEX16 n=1 Tax=Kwoniella newhampshirensis TaxID=1651941 RepID=A0AAW0YZL1_9TREE